MLQKIKLEIQNYGSPAKAQKALRFFKTQPGQYGHGDIFIGLTADECRRIAKKYQDLPIKIVESLLQSEIHEERAIALAILCAQFAKGGLQTQEKIVKVYLKQKKHINNWDLIDGSAPKILGAYLFGKDLSILQSLATSKSLWDRRIAILATFYFIQQGDGKETLRLAKVLLRDPEDLMHKAVGWMLREVGKRVSETQLKIFLDKHATQMPRTMLRYSLERLSAKDRQKYMAR